MAVTLEQPTEHRNGVAPRPVPKQTLKQTVTAEPAATPLLRLLIVVAAMIGAVLEVLDTSITNVAIPQMQGNLGATLSQIGWVNTGYIISNVIVLPITGWLADRFGRQRYFAASITAFTLASLMCGVSHSLGSLIFWRIVQGLGGGGLLSTGQVIMLQAFPKSQGGIATAIFGVGVMVGPSLGPVLGGWLTDNYSWPWIFFVNLPFGIAAVVMTLLFVPNVGSGKAGTYPVDFLGIGLLAAGLGAMQTVLERGQEDDWFQSREVIFLSITAIVGLIGFIWRELSTAHPIVNLRLLKNRSLAAGSLFGLVIGLGLYATTYLLPIFLQDSQGYTAYETGMSLLPSAILSAVSFVIAGPLSQKADSRALLAFGVVSFILGCYGLSHLTAQTGTGDVFWPLMGRGLSLGFLFIPMTVASLGSLKPSEIGEGSGFINLTRQLGGSVGIAAFSTLLTRRQDFHRASLADHINQGNPAVHNWLNGAQAALTAHGYTATDAASGAMGQLESLVRQQAAILSFNDAFLMIAAAFLLALPLVFVFEKNAVAVDTSAAH